ncbi:hypothetical protein MPTK1_2g11310 [Marchantia polymorpha subsp. ruderalis]|uniref:Uncharacterized protein n=2 Tax=Marchantia polymorpha TaxID=3197 RepID=A0A176VJQ8_MARPO|nr:hypothetical protein AXG93_872s1230 [Marchantia polymorpha subsp. ruderalis]PTQ43791.1 hypothetical protein MARPO_0023s0099 [Marchantia polymorpha]BBN01928.1 hypothetical protein Mp_2g11310 [Marchantia polymorpha subsp. ruderalis]|eukprot:PTQ43791.1 hypothetical protein MARPO_0023s0099 [Marchantia polymorpha]
MNLGQQMVFPVLAGTIDEATRERLLAEHLASNLQNNSLSTALANAGFIPANAFINLSTPGAVVNHTINLLRAPVASLAQSIGLQNTAAVVGHHLGLKAAGLPLNNRLQVPNVGINHNLGLNLPVGANPHHYITALPGIGINMGPKAPGVNMNNSTMGSKVPGPGVGSSSSMNTRSPGSSSSNNNLASRLAMAGGPQNMMQRVGHPGLMRTGSWQAPPQSAGIHMGIPQANATHMTAYPSHQRTAVQGVSGYPQQKHKSLGPTYLDDFKQGFPSKGLSVLQNRWWGSAEPSKRAEVSEGTEKDTSHALNAGGTSCKGAEADRTIHAKVADEKSKEILSSCAKLSAIRRRASDGGRSALQLAVSRGYGVQKIGHQQSKALQFVFGNSLPKQWSAALVSSD